MVEVFDEQFDILVLVEFRQLCYSYCLLSSSSRSPLFFRVRVTKASSPNVRVMKVIVGTLGIRMVLKANKTKVLGMATAMGGGNARSNWPKRDNESFEFNQSCLGIQVFDIDVGELGLHLLDLSLLTFASEMLTDVHLPVFSNVPFTCWMVFSASSRVMAFSAASCVSIVRKTVTFGSAAVGGDLA
ncbi:hypothetical protein BG004_007541 [Podila humilis]|nr:hypothetical protein BG004_007541 [Podila humilis]